MKSRSERQCPQKLKWECSLSVTTEWPYICHKPVYSFGLGSLPPPQEQHAPSSKVGPGLCRIHWQVNWVWSRCETAGAGSGLQSSVTHQDRGSSQWSLPTQPFLSLVQLFSQALHCFNHPYNWSYFDFDGLRFWVALTRHCQWWPWMKMLNLLSPSIDTKGTQLVPGLRQDIVSLITTSCDHQEFSRAVTRVLQLDWKWTEALLNTVAGFIYFLPSNN